MLIETRRLSELRHAAYNPRKALMPDDSEYQNIKRSIEEFGLVDPLVVNSDDTIIGGHQRATVLADMGFDDVNCVIVDFPEDKAKALNIALNKITGAWDEEKLHELLSELEAGGLELSLTGFTQDEVDKLEALVGTVGGQDDDFDVDTALNEIDEPVTRPGDVWQLGEHHLLCGDATNAADMARLMGDERARLLLTDPPYNVDYHGEAGAIENDNLPDDDFEDFLKRAFWNIGNNLAGGSAFYVFHASENSEVFRKAITQFAHLEIKQCLIWVKNHFRMGRRDYHYKHEPIFYGWESKGCKHYFTASRKKSTVYDDTLTLAACELMDKPELYSIVKVLLAEREAMPSSVLYCDKPLRSEEHPTMKPVSLLTELIQNSSRKGWAVLDPFGGSGSTLIACEQTGRRCFMMELEPCYCDVIRKRWEALTGKTAVRQD